MSDHQPDLQQYPGYYPAGTKKFWTRTKVGTATGVAGLLVGIALSAPIDASPAATQRPTGITQADLSSAVDDATSELEDQLQDQEALLERQESQAAAATRKAAQRAEREQARAVKAAIAKTQRTERALAAKAVERARREATQAAQAAQQSAPAPQPLASTGGTDPRFSYCYEANDAGYGPYYQGQDPEYDWYDDADNDGIVCET